MSVTGRMIAKFGRSMILFLPLSLVFQVQHMRPNDPYPTDSIEKEELDKVMFISLHLHTMHLSYNWLFVYMSQEW